MQLTLKKKDNNNDPKVTQMQPLAEKNVEAAAIIVLNGIKGYVKQTVKRESQKIESERKSLKFCKTSASLSG